MSEAAWCGLPCVALRDGRGVSSQIRDGETGLLVGQVGRTAEANGEFGAAVVGLLEDPARLRAMGARGAELTRERTSPKRCIQRYYEAFEQARRHLSDHPPAPRAGSTPARMARWTALHAALVGLGYLRPRATVNKNHSKQPSWGELAEVPKPGAN